MQTFSYKNKFIRTLRLRFPKKLRTITGSKNPKSQLSMLTKFYKVKLRTNWGWNLKKNKNIKAQPEFAISYKKNVFKQFKTVQNAKNRCDWRRLTFAKWSELLNYCF